VSPPPHASITATNSEVAPATTCFFIRILRFLSQWISVLSALQDQRRLRWDAERWIDLDRGIKQ
jgi:hypothetical protein